MKKHLLTILFFLVMLPAFAQNIIGGIGAQLFLDTAGGFTMPRIMSLIRNSPAYDTLKATDYIMKVDDVSCKDKTIEEIVGMIRGEAGTKVKITVADTKQGARPREYTLTRASMQVAAPPNAAPPDPVPAFNAACDNEVKQLKKKGFEIIKTYTSECGNFFFNFNAVAAAYHVHVYTMEEKGAGANAPAFYATAKVFDGDHEADATELSKLPSTTTGAAATGHLEGTVTFKRDCVGVVGITIHDDVKKCKAMYVIVYK